MWGIIEAVGTAFRTVTESLELVVEVLCLSTANQVLRKKRPWDKIVRIHTFSGLA